FNKNIEKLRESYNLVPVCPEIYGGFETPREPCEILKGRVLTQLGEDVTKYYYAGAEEVLKLAEFFECKYAILKERSPSCGYNEIYDGTFSGNIVKGSGIAATMLSDNGIKILGESRIEELL
ncbi:MAG: DUF523 domain-containing protein, partial [Clostridia bacterium]|nr:DUF523 domain-containing protein [Clostridia bacterium]